MFLLKVTNSENEIKILNSINKHSITSNQISVPKRTLIHFTGISHSCEKRCNKAVPPTEALLENKVKNAFHTSYERYQKSPEKYSSAAESFIRFSQELTLTDIITNPLSNRYPRVLSENFEKAQISKSVFQIKQISLLNKRT